VDVCQDGITWKHGVITWKHGVPECKERWKENWGVIRRNVPDVHVRQLKEILKVS